MKPEDEPLLARTGGSFLGFDAPVEAASLVLFGAPLDVTTSFRPGTRFGPSKVRQVSDGLETYSPYLDQDLLDRSLADAGDVRLCPGTVEQALDAIERAAAQLMGPERPAGSAGGPQRRGGAGPAGGNGGLGAARRLLMLGGEHLATLGAVRAAARRFPGLVVVQLDAHADLREDYLGLRLSHATVMRRVQEVLGESRLVQLGIRSGTREEFQRLSGWADASPGVPLVDAARRVAARLAESGTPFYLTVDIDVVDPAYAPGTGTPEPGGVSSKELLEAVRALCGAGPVAMDIVELCPPQDPSDVTTLLVAKLVREMALAVPAAGMGGRGQ